MLLQSLVYFELCIIQSFHFIEYTEILPANAIKNKTMQKKNHRVVKVSISHVWSNGYFLHCRETRVTKESNLLFAILTLEFQIALTVHYGSCILGVH